MPSLMRVVSRLTGRTGSIGRRRGLKDRSPSGAYSSSSRFHAAARSSSAFDSVEPHAGTLAREVRNGSAPAFQESKGSKLRHEVGKPEGLLRPAALADGQAVLALAVAVDDHVRDLLQLGLADALADRLRRLPHVDAIAR